MLAFLSQCTRVSVHQLHGGEWVDLTYSYSEETLFWPTANPFRLDTVFAGTTDGGFYYEAYEFRTAEHGGTHLDAPIHFAEGQMSVDELDVSRLNGMAAVVDVRSRVEENRDYRIRTEDILEWEREHGILQPGTILLFHTGMGAHWPDASAYLGTEKRGDEGVAELSFPGIHPDTATWLTQNRSIRAVGLDTPSLDYGRSTQFETHQILFRQNIPGFENVANLHLLPPTGAFIIALPMKIQNGSGAPLRIVAHLNE